MKLFCAYKYYKKENTTNSYSDFLNLRSVGLGASWIQATLKYLFYIITSAKKEQIMEKPVSNVFGNWALSK